MNFSDVRVVGKKIVDSLSPGDLVKFMPTDDVMMNCPDYAGSIGTVIEMRDDEFYTDSRRPDGGPWQVARIFVHSTRRGMTSVKEWSLKVWGEDLELLQEAE